MVGPTLFTKTFCVILINYMLNMLSVPQHLCPLPYIYMPGQAWPKAFGTFPCAKLRQLSKLTKGEKVYFFKIYHYSTINLLLIYFGTKKGTKPKPVPLFSEYFGELKTFIPSLISRLVDIGIK